MAESMQGLHRTCRCAEVTKEMKGKEIVLMGWVQKARDKGGIIFVDLLPHYLHVLKFCIFSQLVLLCIKTISVNLNSRRHTSIYVTSCFLLQ